MKSKFEKLGDTVIVKLDGKIDYESQEPFKESLRTLERDKKTDTVPKKVIFNLERLEFVGSSGISQLIQTLKDFGARTDQKANIQNASNEFKKVMRALTKRPCSNSRTPLRSLRPRKDAFSSISKQFSTGQTSKSRIQRKCSPSTSRDPPAWPSGHAVAAAPRDEDSARFPAAVDSA